MISQFADQAKVQNIFANARELEKFAFEFCKEFKCTVQEPVKDSRLSSVTLVTDGGLPCGRLMVDMSGERDKETGKYVPVYYYESPIVNKSKGSARAARDCRDSITIKGLIAAVKKHNEGPTTAKLQNNYANGIRYAFGSTNRGRGRPRIDLREDVALALVLSHLQVDTNSIKQYDAQLVQEYEKYLISIEQSKQSMSTYERFCKGSYVIGVMRTSRNESPYYVVGEVAYATSSTGDDHVHFQTPLKRYSSLMNCPEVAPHVPIIAAWAGGQSNRDDDNELKLPRTDRYWEEIDVATGYASSSECWHLIPKECE